MTDDLIAQIRAYSQQLAEEMIPIESEEGIPVVVAQRVPRPKLPPTRPRWVFALAAVVTVLLFGLVVSLLRSPQAPPVATILATTTSAAPATTLASPENLDVFTSIRGWIIYRLGSELVAVDPDNPEATRSLGPANDLQPVGWSADGTRLLLTLRPSAQNPVGSGLYVMNADGSVEQWTSASNSSGSLSPDGTAIAYLSGGFDCHSCLFVSEAVGATPRVLADSEGRSFGGLTGSAWSPVGSQIAFVRFSEMSGIWSISVVNVDGTGLHVIKEPDDMPVSGLAWSPDGSQLAFIGQPNEPPWGVEVYVMNADGSEPQLITNGSYSLSSPAWSPDGSRIAFVRDNGPIVIVAADGSDEQVIESVYVRDYGTIAWHPIG